MSNISDFLPSYLKGPVVAISVVIIASVYITFAIIQSRRNDKRVRQLLAKYPGAEKTEVFIASGGDGAGMPPEVIDAKVTEMESSGWILLYCKPTVGRFVDKPGVTLQFLRVPIAEIKGSARNFDSK